MTLPRIAFNSIDIRIEKMCEREIVMILNIL